MLKVRGGNVKPPRMPKNSTEDHLDAGLVQLSARMMLRTRHEHGSVGPSQISLFQALSIFEKQLPTSLTRHVIDATPRNPFLSRKPRSSVGGHVMQNLA